MLLLAWACKLTCFGFAAGSVETCCFPRPSAGKRPTMDSESEYSDDGIDGADFDPVDEQSNQARSPITKEDVMRGLDPQGIPWSTLGTT
jgi:hypothetical protein